MADNIIRPKGGEYNILLIGNSYSYYWLDELWGLLKAAGYETVRVCDVYYSGCSFKKHWNWYEAGEAHYCFQIFEGLERRTLNEVDLNTCLNYAQWDAIGFQQSGGDMYAGDTVTGPVQFREGIYNYLPQLYEVVRSRFPKAQYYWTQHWVHEVGTSGAKGLPDLQTQEGYMAGYRAVSKEVCKDFGFVCVPMGDAWQAVRHDPLFYEAGNGEYPARTLHTRVLTASFKSYPSLCLHDLSHDGDIGGGQYLNACVWFECLTGQSVVGNPFRMSYYHEPTDTNYALTEAQIEKLQAAAHDAVKNYYSEAFYGA